MFFIHDIFSSFSALTIVPKGHQIYIFSDIVIPLCFKVIPYIEFIDDHHLLIYLCLTYTKLNSLLTVRFASVLCAFNSYHASCACFELLNP